MCTRAESMYSAWLTSPNAFQLEPGSQALKPKTTGPGLTGAPTACRSCWGCSAREDIELAFLAWLGLLGCPCMVGGICLGFQGRNFAPRTSRVQATITTLDKAEIIIVTDASKPIYKAGNILQSESDLRTSQQPPETHLPTTPPFLLGHVSLKPFNFQPLTFLNPHTTPKALRYSPLYRRTYNTSSSTLLMPSAPP